MATNYPGAVDSLPRPTSSTQMDATGYEGDVVIDNISDAIEAIETELGTDPAGPFATVKARLAAAERPQPEFTPSGTFIGPAGWTGYSASTLLGSTVTGSSGYMIAVPLFLDGATAIDGAAMNVGTATEFGTLRFGLYADVVGTPTDLVKDFGEVSVTTTGDKVASVTSFTPTAGWYWLAMFAPDFSTLGCTTNPLFRGWTTASTGPVVISSNSGRYGRIQNGNALHDPTTALGSTFTWSFTLGSAGANQPYLALRVA